jgi:hypothetical protein
MRDKRPKETRRYQRARVTGYSPDMDKVNFVRVLIRRFKFQYNFHHGILVFKKPQPTTPQHKSVLL